MNRSQSKLQLGPNKEINFRSGLFARLLGKGRSAWPSLITQLFLFRHSDGAHRLVTCASARSLLSDGINSCREQDFLPFFLIPPCDKSACGWCLCLHFGLGFLSAKAGQSCALLCLGERAERFVMVSQFLQEFETQSKEHKYSALQERRMEF